jgi:hypothetical protein
MAHNAQVIDIAFYLAELGAQGVYLIAIAEGDHPALKRIFQHDADPAGDHREIVKAADLIVGVFRQHGLRGEEGTGSITWLISWPRSSRAGWLNPSSFLAAWLITSMRRSSSMAITPS